jgi:curli production assembly/transport component CsgG
METSRLLAFLSVILLSSCSLARVQDAYDDHMAKDFLRVASILELQSKELQEVQAPTIKPVVAVYGNSFSDQTGQRKSNSQFALFSSAITQAPDTLLIRALKHASGGNFFRVVERVGLDNLTKERQLIRSTREQFEEKDGKKPLMPLLFAGVLIEGAVISYDTNTRTGGIGARYLGVGSSTQYREDILTVSLRMVSVATGEILIEVTSQKTIFSYGQSQDLFRFYEQSSELVELEIGMSENESATLALQKAIEGALLQLINIGYERGYWSYEENNN